MINDPISDMLTRIRNASLVKKAEIILPFSKMKFSIAKLLKEQGYISDFGKLDDTLEAGATQKIKINGMAGDHMTITLKYENNRPAITSLKRVSKPGRRVYVKKDSLPSVLNNIGIAILSTPQGLMTNKEAKKLGLGGEVICEIY